MEDTNIEFILRGLDGGDRRLIISKDNAAALAAGATVIVDDETWVVGRIMCYLSITEKLCFMTASLPVMEIKKRPDPAAILG